MSDLKKLSTSTILTDSSPGGVAPEPLVRPLPARFTPEYCFRRLAQRQGCVWLDSSLQHQTLGRYSYMAVEPFCKLRIEHQHAGALDLVDDLLQRYPQARVPNLPPFQGGWLGWFGYELGGCFERIPRSQRNDFSLPVASLGLYDVVLCWDHVQDTGWIVSQGFPETSPRGRQRRAYQRMKALLKVLAEDAPEFVPSHGGYTIESRELAPQFSTNRANWTSNFSAADFRATVARGVEYIHAGDIFQVNLSQRLLTPATATSPELYLHLRQVSPAPFSGYADFGRVQVVSSSPERFLNLYDGQLETRPIKGTRPRLSDPTADRGMAALLQSSEKDRSENVMIVDLMRNDLSRVSEIDSLQIDSLCGLEQYPFVWHLVSVLKSKLRPDAKVSDIFRSAYPGGSITGAPKIRAMEIISELEPTVRGPYCGSMGYISFSGDMDLSILIRTITACNGWWQAPVGGGIVADSDPMLEEQETWHKAEGMLKAIDSLR